MTLEKLTILTISIVVVMQAISIIRLQKYVERLTDDVFILTSQTDWRLKKIESEGAKNE